MPGSMSTESNGSTHDTFQQVLANSDVWSVRLGTMIYQSSQTNFAEGMYLNHNNKWYDQLQT